MLTDKQINQLKYELKRKFVSSFEHALDVAIDQVVEKGVEFESIVTIQLRMQTKVLKEVKDGAIQLEQTK